MEYRSSYRGRAPLARSRAQRSPRVAVCWWRLRSVEARSILGWKESELFILSLGCTEEILDIPTAAGYKDLLLKSTELFMRGQSRASAGTAKLLCEHTEAVPRYFRYQPAVPVGKFALDRVEMIDRLRGLGVTCAREALPALQQHFLDEPALGPTVCSHRKDRTTMELVARIRPIRPFTKARCLQAGSTSQAKGLCCARRLGVSGDR